MKQVVLKLDFHDERTRKKIMKTVSGHSGVDSISMDSKDMKLTVTGDIDPVTLVSKLRKLCNADILSVGPPKAPEKKKEEPKKEEPKKEDPKKDKDDLAELLKIYRAHNPQMVPVPQYYVRSVEEDPNACVIC
ncbi:heavy metal-associated isoprenylated plant protein 39-like [Humulus lupulus]|uniref:heavy metal-associated isoprenylated plant protein 39-like n=1 Tax=Humulus lupulus TaxID=3486 RepID=UPI002B40FC98|nr:heavy metal-associated isoprenylated plant protein 39-like [Humulus lupulus]